MNGEHDILRIGKCGLTLKERLVWKVMRSLYNQLGQSYE